jgi:hypothetical protein
VNTRIRYHYQDEANFEAKHEVILKGEISEEQTQLLKSHLYDEKYFIPGQVGLPDLQHILKDWVDSSDHPGHTFIAISSTQRPPSQEDSCTIDEFVEIFLSAQWDKDYRPEEWEEVS